MVYLGKPVLANFKPPREQRKRMKSPAEKRDGKDPAYLKKIDSLPCCVCGKAPPSEHHHLKSAGKRGGAMKSEDKWTLPMCNEHHIFGVERVGSKREVGWFRERGIDCLSLASALYQNRHSTEAMLAVLLAHRREL